ncbi:hypothetical protein IV203_029429 [Nitzschia inconspicua]|uniref:Uncharacterized protein n=1 Tax=Nitzschia inconspicua TaxID=303405 RepID=A0A9K3LRV1_9STRA|nr:hypothetical protein IV203_029429 [Nitzschia inconspicua]
MPQQCINLLTSKIFINRSFILPIVSIYRTSKAMFVPFDSQAHYQPIFGTPDRYLSCPTVSLERFKRCSVPFDKQPRNAQAMQLSV